ncbi:hypothetical protein PWY87_34055 [Kribbella solani]|uniref:hypothetical protein n=1 Tax=Kribbella solani TaxID=236067 RepID=UPI0029B78247|nr:hypothetical protein [Kribbella solani]MDX3006741.1 hypothetical protein [Kribbella solani]
MASKNQVTLTFAGDSSKLESAFKSVGSAADSMKTQVGSASKKVEESASAYDKAGEAADNVDTKAMGFRDTLTGVQDTMGGVSMIAKGDLFNGFFTLGAGIGDLGSGFYNLLIPAMKGFSKEALVAKANTVGQTVATVASKTAQVAVAGATKAWAAAQWLMNAALTANPIGLVIAAVALLVTGLVIAYKKSETFRTIVNGAFGAVRQVGQAVFGWFQRNWHTIADILLAPFNLVIQPIWKNRDAILNAVKSVPGAIAGFMKNVAGIITAPFRAAFNGIRSAWNSTVGGKGFTVPGWVPGGLGGKGFTIPYFHTGGIVSGALGSESLAVLKAGERVTAGSNSAPAPQGPMTVEVHVEIGGEVVRVVRSEIRASHRELKRTVKAAA